MVVLHTARHRAASRGRSTARRRTRLRLGDGRGRDASGLRRLVNSQRNERVRRGTRRFPMHESCGICLQDINEGEPTTYLHMHSAHTASTRSTRTAPRPQSGPGRSCPTCRQDPEALRDARLRSAAGHAILRDGAAPRRTLRSRSTAEGGGGPVPRSTRPRKARHCGHRMPQPGSRPPTRRGATSGTANTAAGRGRGRKP